MRFRVPFTVFPRRRKDGRVVFYYRIYDEDGKRLPARSPGTTSQSVQEWVAYIDAARTWTKGVYEKTREGKLIEGHGGIEKCY